MKSRWWLAALGICLLLAVVSPLASSSPDGLEKVAEDKGFLHLADGSSFHVIADYLFPGVQNEALATVFAGVTGTLLLFVLAYGLAWLIVAFRRRKTHLNGSKPE